MQCAVEVAANLVEGMRVTVAISRKASIINWWMHWCQITICSFRLIGSFGGEIVFIGITWRRISPLNFFVSLHVWYMLSC